MNDIKWKHKFARTLPVGKYKTVDCYIAEAAYGYACFTGYTIGQHVTHKALVKAKAELMRI